MTDQSTAVPDLPTAAARSHRPTAAPPRPRVLPLALGCVLVTALITIATCADVRHPVFQGLDDRWLGWMGGPHAGAYEAVASALNWFGGPLGVVVPLALLVALIAARRWWSVLYLLTTYLVASMLVVQVLKQTVDRPRPAHPLVRVDHGSFPSGHAAGAATLVVLVGVLLIPLARRRAWWLGGAVFVALMMWSRTWLHAHWLSDTFAGALAGAGTSLLLWWAFAPLLAREDDKQAR